MIAPPATHTSEPMCTGLPSTTQVKLNNAGSSASGSRVAFSACQRSRARVIFWRSVFILAPRALEKR